MFPFSPQQASPIAANMQALVSVTKRYAAGLQQIAELNVQTVKTVLKKALPSESGFGRECRRYPEVTKDADRRNPGESGRLYPAFFVDRPCNGSRIS